MAKRDEAKQDYLAGMKYKEIAEKYGVTLNTVKSWKTRHWNKESEGAPVEKSVHTKTKKCAHKKELHPAIQELEDSDLNDKQKRFASEVVRLANATQAYINAYDVDYDTAKVNASRLLTNANIQTEIKRLRQARLAELDIDVFSLVDDMAKEAKADIGTYADWGSDEFQYTDEMTGKELTGHKSWVALKDKSKVDTKAIKKITVGKDGPIVELHDRNKARKELLEYLNGKGVFDSGTNNGEMIINMDSFEEIKHDGD
ncbi:terminase small subunit [Fructobacillus fructosus]|uniref:terminase small subunit n=1 Tax=Fructobacillus fructosus TaxID=1631 RepID=UPI002DA4FA6B|nr:Phage terminase [Fructobacillus fructosus]CAK1222613.1 Phage terminase [Fructobacillus fructosus]CAK1222723.1 Phage terminase [Fructobacillus fructosus]